MINPQIRSLIVNRYRGKWRAQWQSDVTTARIWQKLTPETVVDLIADAAARPRYTPDGPSTKFLAGQLLRDMQRDEWRIGAAPHEGGKHGSTSKDENLHITVNVGSKNNNLGYHLRCKESPALHVIQITDGPPED